MGDGRRANALCKELSVSISREISREDSRSGSGSSFSSNVSSNFKWMATRNRASSGSSENGRESEEELAFARNSCVLTVPPSMNMMRLRSVSTEITTIVEEGDDVQAEKL